MAELSTLARPYAKSAFSFSLARKNLDLWSKLLDESSFIVSQEKVSGALTSPKMTPTEQIALITQVLGNDIDKYFINFITLLADNKRLSLLPAIAGQFNSLKQKQEQMCDVDVISAFETDADIEQHLMKVLETTLNCHVTVHTSVDKDLIGGVVIRAGDLVIDNSIRGRLAKLSEAMGL